MRRSPFAPSRFAGLPIRLAAILAAVVLFGPTLLVAAQEERGATFHGNVARTGEQPGPNPKGKGTLLWRFQTEGAIRTSPIVADGTIYFGSNDGRLYAIDAKNGEPLWSFAAGGAIRSTPAVDEGLVVFGSDDGYVYCVSADKGELRWRFRIGRFEVDAGRTLAEFLPRRTVTASPLVVDGIVYIGSNDQSLHAIDLKTGIEKWSAVSRGPTVSTPSYKDGVVYVGSEAGVYAFDAQTGHTLWAAITGLPVEDDDDEQDDDEDGIPNSEDDDDDNDGIPDTQDDENNAAGNDSGNDSGDEDGDNDDLLGGEEEDEFTLDDALADGALTVSEYFVLLGGFTWNVTASPVVVDNLVYAVGLAESEKKLNNGEPATVGGVLLQLDVASGEVTGIWIFFAFDLVTTTPSVVDGAIYLGSDRGMVLAVEATLLSPTLIDPDDSQDANAEPGDEITTFAANQQRWGVQTEGYVLASPAVVGETIYVGNAGGTLYSLDTKSGRQRWTFQTDGPIWSSPTIDDGIVYVGSDDGFLYAIGGSS